MRNPRSSRIPRTRRTGAIVACAALALSLVGCTTTEEDPTSEDTARPTSSPTDEPTTGATPTPTPTTPISIEVTAACEDLVPLQALYNFNPNFGIAPDYAPAPGTLPAEAVELDGVACGFVNQTSGVNIEFAVAHLIPEELQKAKDALVVSNDPVPTYVGEEAYFTVEDEVGQAQVFTGEYWLVARSSAFYEPGDNAGLVNSVVENLNTLQP